jgi:hypothetical protein
MPVAGYKTFDGEIPRLAPHLLPDRNAQLAVNCDFGDGTLRALKGGLLLAAMVNNPVRGIYTEDGILYYTWTAETLAFESPIIDDAFARMYYLTPSEGIFRVATTAGMAFNGPSPSTYYKVGLPRPTVAPVLRTVERTTLVDYPNATASATAWWDYAGVKYSEAVVSLSVVTSLRTYTFTAPSLPGSPPENVTPTLMVRLQYKDPDNSDAVLLDTTVAAGSSTRSQAFPGGTEVSMAVSSSNVATISLLWGPMEARAYTYTFENTWDEESAPAPPATISPSYIQDVVVTVTAGVFTGYRAFDNYNIYRTYGTNTTYIKTAVSGSAPNFTDSSRRPSSVGVVMLSTDYYPPVEGLAGAEVMPGGWFVFFKGNTLYKTAPYRPHAVPYSEVFPTSIRGVKASQLGLTVTTADGVYVVPGLKPSQSGYIGPLAPQPGVAQRSMANLDGTIAAATNDGIVLVSGSSASMAASQKLFTREKWREMYGDILLDASMRFGYHDGMLVAASRTEELGFLLRLDENVGSFTRIEQEMEAMLMLPVNDALYYSDADSVYEFNAGEALTFDWWGKDWVYPYDISMGCAYISTVGTINVKIYADGVLWREVNTTTGFFRIPPRRAHIWSVRFGGTGQVKEFQMATTMTELSGV